jgi:hypothetical protein
VFVIRLDRTGSSKTTTKLIGKVEDRTMKIQTTKRSISCVTLLGLLTLIAVAWVRYVAAEGERAFAAAGGDAVTVWNANAGVAATEACIAPLDNPLHESRIYAMMHVAIHDALNAIDRRSRPYAFDVQAEAGASPDAAVAAAARYVLVPLIAQLPLELHTQANRQFVKETQSLERSNPEEAVTRLGLEEQPHGVFSEWNPAVSCSDWEGANL